MLCALHLYRAQADGAFMKGLLSPGEAPEEGPLEDDLLDLLVAEARGSGRIFSLPALARNEFPSQMMIHR